MAEAHHHPAIRALPNPRAVATLPGPAPDRVPLAFHRQLPGYGPTPLVEAPDLARALGVGQVWVKDESARLGLPAFKVLGASWAGYRALQAHLGGAFDPALPLDALRARLAPRRPLTLAAATDGNHGRAVARLARWLDLDARIFVPADMVAARRAAIAAEGAAVVVVDGSYDEAVARAAGAAGPRCLVLADTAWPGYEDVPRWVVEGYATILWEVDDELARRGAAGPDLVAIQIGVGALAAAVTRHYRRPGAACVLASVAAGRPVAVPGPHRSIMAGLNCGQPSPVAWPVVSRGIDLFVAIGDERAREAMRALAGAGIVAGETGAAGLGGLLARRRERGARATLAPPGVTPRTRVLLFNTEGATDPAAYARVVGRAVRPG
ncbi:MAG: Diaminopropionate ammonia-lyase [uncultured Thermomicrobiales bacterium]|uniref:Diaminopropionate ammonia-lyase n=1 Tax=uncultured Thermomicrobiales bacterium TaxID=1645740 RepID=A0A6J4V310_9BACT|nr:MAG: Diaminopropionate ammonia-lyase [uncultured Thermomicrobiales bacterium]